MQILNATNQVKSLMTDRGEIISVSPGELSRVFIASRNLICGAIAMGSQKEIGIILGGSYEMEIAKQINASIPYIYMDSKEAISKLIDPSIDYKGSLNADKLNATNEIRLKEKDEELKSAYRSIDKLKDKISNLTDEAKLNNADLLTKYNKLDEDFKRVQIERDRINSQLTESQDQINSMTSKLNELREQNGKLTQDYSNSQSMITNLTAELSDSKASNKTLDDELKIQMTDNADKTKQIENLNSEITKLKESNDTTEIDALKKSLESATETIDNMKVEFNDACAKFNITKDENGEWIQSILS